MSTLRRTWLPAAKLSNGTNPADISRYSAGNDKFILKNVSQSSFVDYQDMYRSLRSCPHLRVSCDTIPEQSTFVYKYLSDDLLSLAQKDLPLMLVKRILKDALRGLAALHDRDIVHTGIPKLSWKSDPAIVNLLQISRQITFSSSGMTLRA